jgi:ATP-binding cassette subfamily F protein uup
LPSRKKLSPTEQHVLKTSPGRIAALHDEVRRLEALLANPDFYARDRAGFEKTGAALAEAQDTLAELEEEWLNLELKREEMVGG